jgi:hypothetical protein
MTVQTSLGFWSVKNRDVGFHQGIAVDARRRTLWFRRPFGLAALPAGEGADQKERKELDRNQFLHRAGLYVFKVTGTTGLVL